MPENPEPQPAFHFVCTRDEAKQLIVARDLCVASCPEDCIEMVGRS